MNEDWVTALKTKGKSTGKQDKVPKEEDWVSELKKKEPLPSDSLAGKLPLEEPGEIIETAVAEEPKGRGGLLGVLGISEEKPEEPRPVPPEKKPGEAPFPAPGAPTKDYLGDTIIQPEPDLVTSVNQKIYIASLEGDDERVSKLISESLISNPADPYANKMIYYYAKRGKAENIEPILDKALAHNPGDINLLIDKSLHSYNKGDYNSALLFVHESERRLREALKTTPDDISLNMALSEALNVKYHTLGNIGDMPELEMEQAKAVIREKVSLDERVEDLKDKQATPTSLEYMIQKGTERTALGFGLMAGLPPGSVDYRYDRFAGYEPTWYEEAGAGTLSLLLDLPLFAVGGTAASSAFRGGQATYSIVTRAVPKLIEGGMTRTAAEGTVKKLAEEALKKWPLYYTKASLESAGALGFFGGARDFLEQLSDPDTDLTDVNYSQVLKTTMKDAAMGAVIGPIGVGTGKIARAIEARIPGVTGFIVSGAERAAGFGAEVGVFTYGGAGMEGRSPYEVTIEELLMTGIPLLGPKMVRFGKQILTPEGREKFFTSRSFSQNKANQGVFRVELDFDELQAMRYPNTDAAIKGVTSSKQSMIDFLGDETIPQSAKVKVLWASQGKGLSNFPTASAVEVIQAGERAILVGRNSEGSIVVAKSFDSKAEADAEAVNMAALIKERVNRMKATALNPLGKNLVLNMLRGKGVDMEALRGGLEKFDRPWERTQEEVKAVNNFDSEVDVLFDKAGKYLNKQFNEPPALKMDDLEMADEFNEKLSAIEGANERFAYIKKELPFGVSFVADENIYWKDPGGALKWRKVTEGVPPTKEVRPEAPLEEIKTEPEKPEVKPKMEEPSDAEKIRKGIEERGEQKPPELVEGEEGRLRLRDLEKERLEAERPKEEKVEPETEPTFITSKGEKVHIVEGDLNIFDKAGKEIPKILRISIDKKTGKKKPIYNPKFTKAKREYFENLEIDNGKPKPEPPEAYDEHIVRNTENPSHLVDIWEKTTTEYQESIYGGKEWWIAEYLNKVKGTTRGPDKKFVPGSFAAVDDISNVTQGIARAYFNEKTGTSIDLVAQEASIGFTGNPNITDAIKPQEVTDFIKRYPNGKQGFYNYKSDLTKEAEARFKDLTGLNLDKSARQAAENERNRKKEESEWERKNIKHVTDEFPAQLSEPLTLENLPLYKKVFTKEEYKQLEELLKNERFTEEYKEEVSPPKAGERPREGEEVPRAKEAEVEPSELERERRKKLEDIETEIVQVESDMQKELDRKNKEIEIPFEDLKPADELFAMRREIEDQNRQAITKKYEDKIAKLKRDRARLMAEEEKAREGDERQQAIPFVDEDIFPPGAAVGDFAEGKKAKAEEYEPLKPMESPELVTIAQAIIDYFGVRKLPGKVKGQFKVELDKLKILISPEMLKIENLEQFVKALAHEIGHAINYLPDHIIKRGNILGMLGTLNKYKGKFLPFKKGWPGELTKEDIERLKALAKETSKDMIVEKEVDEEIIRTIGIEPQDVLDIWNKTAGSRSPKLTEFVKVLNAAQKKNIVKEAIKGKIAEELKGLVDEVREKTGRKIKVSELIKGDWRKKLSDLINGEIKKRKLFSENEIYYELYDLSRKWRPFDERTASPRLLKYRRDPNELYADAISVLLNDPSYLKQEAPKFYQGFKNYMEEKPEFEKAYLEIQDLLRDPLKVKEARLEQVHEDFKEGERLMQELITKDKKRPKLGIVGKFINDYISQIKPSIKFIPDKVELGAYLSPRQIQRNELELLRFINNQEYLFAHSLVADVLVPLETFRINYNDVGAIMMTERQMVERLEKANPRGWQGQINQEMKDFIYDKYSPEQAKIIDQAKKRYHELIWEKVLDLYKEGGYTEKIWKEKILPYEHVYATYWVLDYITKNYIPAGVQEIVGTFKPIANPLIATAVKANAIIRLTQRQRSVNTLIENLNQYYKGEWSEAEPVITKKGEKTGLFKNPPEFQGQVGYYKKGVWSAINVDPFIADMFKKFDTGNLDSITKVFWYFNQGFKPIVTKYNPGFAFVTNILRDMSRSAKDAYAIINQKTSLRTKLADLGRVPFSLTKGFFPSLKRGRDILKGNLDDLSKEMIGSGAFSVRTAIMNNYDSSVTDVSDILFSKFGFGNYKLSRHERARKMNKFYDFMGKIHDGYVLAGSSAELGSKINGYKTMRKRIKDAKALGFYTRNYIGTPNFQETGKYTHVTNNLLPFSNVILQALRTDFELMTSPRTASGYWMYMAAWQVIPSTFIGLGAAGVFGDDVKKLYDKIGRYYLNNYLVIPLGETQDGKAKFISIATDEMSRLIHSIVFNLVRNTADKTEGFSFRGWSEIGRIGANMTPSMSPLAEIVAGWLQYSISDVNPYDTYYGRNVVQNIKFKAGGWFATMPMIDWTFKKSGLQNVVSIYSTDKNEQTQAEYWIKAIPAFNRIVRVSGSGVNEFYNELMRPREKERARESIKRTEIIDKYCMETMDGNGSKLSNFKKMIKELAKEGIYDKADYTKLYKKYDVGITKKIKSPFTLTVRRIIEEPINADKGYILVKFRDIEGEEEYKELKMYLISKGIITAGLYNAIYEEGKKELKRREGEKK